MKWTTPAGTIYTLYQDMLTQNHLLIAGATGSGKSVVINALIYTATFKVPSEVALILCDPKMVELSRYAKMPHTLRYADTLDDIKDALEYAHTTMMDRFRAMKRAGQTETTERDIYVIVDEFADLVTKGANRQENATKRACEACIESIGKLGRAAHVHLILATQAPNRQTLKANILLNMTARLALRCMYPIESKQIIGIPAAVTLPDPKTEHRASGYYLHGLELDRWQLNMIPADDIAERIKFWERQKPGGLFSRLFGN